MEIHQSGQRVKTFREETYDDLFIRSEEIHVFFSYLKDVGLDRGLFFSVQTLLIPMRGRNKNEDTVRSNYLGS